MAPRRTDLQMQKTAREGLLSLDPRPGAASSKRIFVRPEWQIDPALSSVSSEICVASEWLLLWLQVFVSSPRRVVSALR